MKLNIIEPELVQKKRLRVCAYARVSTDSEKQENSLENQKISYEKLICSEPTYEFAGLYYDKGVSGRVETRPGFQQMIADARLGKFDLIITKSVSRFARNTVILLKYVRELKDLGIGIVFEENEISTMSAEGEMMLAVIASFAQEECRSMSENKKWTCRKKFEKGELMINTNRFMGYDKDENGNLVINEGEASIVRRIFDLYMSGMGAHSIAKVLNEEGVTTVTGATWHASTIMGMLKNEKYKGDSLLQKTYTPSNHSGTVKNRGEVKQFYVSENHEPIIDPDDWDMVQELIEYNRNKKGIAAGDNKYQSRYPNSHKLICPHCGKYLRRRYVYGRKVEWLCSTYIHKGKSACPGVRVKDSELGDRVFTEPTVVEEVIIDGSKHYSYTAKAEYDSRGEEETLNKEKGGCILPRVDRSRRTAIKL